MDNKLDLFINYLADEKKMSENTRLSYKRDLVKLREYCKGLAIHDVNQVSEANLKSYIVYLEAGDFKAATISRNVASIHAFFNFLYNEHIVDSDVSECLQAPKIEKHAPEILTQDEVRRLLRQPSDKEPKGIRDRAMIELLYATGIRVSELIGLKLGDINLSTGMIKIKKRSIPFGNQTRQSIMRYLEDAREELLKGNESDVLFISCLGEPMSRQGFWKLIKAYGKKAGIEMEITPHTLRHSFAAHLMANGADIKTVSEMLGHSDVYTTQVYAHLCQNELRNEYSSAHPMG